jgi:kynurenine formamidase
MSNVLAKLLEELSAGRLRVVDLTQPLSPQTPLLPLPPQFNNTPAFRIWALSRYDERGPAWYWNAFETGEHTGTHFDAPVHWVSGKDLPDNTVDRIPPKKFVGPACVIDISAEVAENPNYLLRLERVRQWEEQYGRIPAGAWFLLRTDWSKRADPKDYINLKENGPHTPGLAKESSAFLAQQRDVLGVGVETVGTDAGQAATFDPPFPNHYLMHGSGKFGSASADRRHRHCGAIENRRRLRQSAAGHCHHTMKHGRPRPWLWPSRIPESGIRFDSAGSAGETGATIQEN